MELAHDRAPVTRRVDGVPSVPGVPAAEKGPAHLASQKTPARPAAIAVLKTGPEPAQGSVSGADGAFGAHAGQKVNAPSVTPRIRTRGAEIVAHKPVHVPAILRAVGQLGQTGAPVRDRVPVSLAL